MNFIFPEPGAGIRIDLYAKAIFKFVREFYGESSFQFLHNGRLYSVEKGVFDGMSLGDQL
jgi:hypothetical protein